MNVMATHPERIKKLGLRQNLIVSLSLVALFIVLLLSFGWLQIDQEERFKLREESLDLADTLRQSSDDLTSKVRSYVATGNPEAKADFEEIIKIRNGSKGMPLDYDNSYWSIKHHTDRVQRTSPKSYMESVLEHRFTDDELFFLTRALALSNQLVVTEREAMKRSESARTSSERMAAIQMIDDESYHAAKSAIMEKIREFNRKVAIRTFESIHNLDQMLVIIRLTIFVIGILMVISIVRLFKISRATTAQSMEILETYASIVEHSNDVIIGIDLLGIITEWNQSAERMFGYSQDEILGQSIRLLSPKEFIKEENDLLGRLSHGEHIDHFETKRQTRDGRQIDTSITFSPIQNGEGMTVGISMILRDISAQKRMEAHILAATQAKSDFLACMSHEIRTPLNAILGFAQLLEKEPLTNKQHGMIDSINASGRSLIHIINDILDFSRIEAGHIQLENRPFHLDAIIDKIAEVHENACRLKGLNFKVFREYTRSDYRMGDADRLEQVLNNLLSNAVKFTSEGFINIRIAPLFLHESGAYLRFEVEDTGIGVEPGLLPQLFSPFTQADASTTRRFGGSGLGLSICKRLTELMGGEIGAESQVGRGSRFWVDIPFPDARGLSEVPATPLAASSVLSEPKRLRGLRILLADDSEINLLVTRQLLELEGADVISADNGLQAISHLEKNIDHIDILVTDINMPGMDGLTAARFIRTSSLLKNIPIVALSAGILDEEREAALEAGVDDFVEKPVDLDHLVEVLLRSQEHHRTSSEITLADSKSDQGKLPIIDGIDSEIAAENTMGNAAFFKTIIGVFLRDCEQMIPLLREDLSNNNHPEVRRKLHKLDVCADQIGASEISVLAQQAELVIQTPGQVARLKELLADLEHRLNRIGVAARQAFPDLGQSCGLESGIVMNASDQPVPQPHSLP